jgi:hypothetical protein
MRQLLRGSHWNGVCEHFKHHYLGLKIVFDGKKWGAATHYETVDSVI